MSSVNASEVLDGMFKFKIGDIVTHRIGHVPGVVIERAIQQCHGGVQMFYRVRTGGAKEGVDGWSVGDGLRDWIEGELTAEARRDESMTSDDKHVRDIALMATRDANTAVKVLAEMSRIHASREEYAPKETK